MCILLTQSRRCGFIHLLGGQGHWKNVEGPLLIGCWTRCNSQRVGGEMCKVVFLVGWQETVVAQVAVVKHVRTITEVHIQVGQIKIAIHCSRIGIAQQTCHTLELVRSIVVTGSKKQTVFLYVLHITSSAKKKFLKLNFYLKFNFK